MTLKDRTVFVTGATGFLGSALSKSLAAKGIHVKALARHPERARSIKDIANIEIVYGDITNLEQLYSAIQGCEIVFHVAAALSGKLEHQRNVNVIGARNVMKAAADHQTQRVIHVSSIAVYGYAIDHDINEDPIPRPPAKVPYNITKYEAESIARSYSERHSLSYAIIRPGIIYGPGSNMWTKNMFKLVRRKPAIFVGDGKGTAPAIYIDDVVDLLIIAAGHPHAHQQTFHCVMDPPPTWREFLGAYSNLVGHRHWLSIPPPVARLAAYPLELLLTIREEPANLPELVAYSQKRIRFKMDKARALLGWQPQVHLREGIQRTIPYLKEQGLLR